MPIIIEKIEMPKECHGCIFEDRVGGCIILNKTGVCGKSYEEYDDEWFKARKEHRRLKWCPLKKEKRGQWLDDGALYKCSACGHTESYYDMSFCPVCGAYMEG